MARAPTFDRLQWLTWALWRRLPRLGRHETPRGLVYALFDRLAERYVGRCDLFVGWSQVSLRSLRRARRLGAVCLLEHPMSHVETWMTLVQEEYARWGGGSYSLFPPFLVERMKREYEAADYISVLSSFARRTFLEAGAPAGKLIQLPLGVDADLFSPGPREDGPFRVLYVGRLELLKGVQYLLQAFAELALPDAELTLVGPVLPEVRPVLRRFVDARVHVLGEVPHERLPAYYRRADVLVFPSINDAFGLVILEAMACGIPVVATEHSGAPDVIDDGVHGFTVPIRSVGGLKERLQWLATHRDEARQMGRQARLRVLDGFTWRHYEERLIGCYRNLVAHPA